MENFNPYALSLLWALIACIFYFLWVVLTKSAWKEKYDNLDKQIKNIVKAYNKDTQDLHDKNDELHRENVALIVKLRDAETNMISYRTKIRSIETDNVRLKECKGHCKRKCKENKLPKQPVVVLDKPKKKVGRPRKDK